MDLRAGHHDLVFKNPLELQPFRFEVSGVQT